MAFRKATIPFKYEDSDHYHAPDGATESELMIEFLVKAEGRDIEWCTDMQHGRLYVYFRIVE